MNTDISSNLGMLGEHILDAPSRQLPHEVGSERRRSGRWRAHFIGERRVVASAATAQPFDLASSWARERQP
jgi:hypothetical protein